MADFSLANLNWVNFLVGDMETGFGPFVSVHLTAAGWTTGRIGAALSIGTLASLAAQVPAGILVDNSSHKRSVAAAAIAAIMAALLLLAVLPDIVPVLAVELVQGAAGVVLSLSIAAITLGLSRQEALGERLGNNVRFAAVGAAAGAGLLGLVGGVVSHAAVFIIAAGFGAPALWALSRISRADLLDSHTRTSHHTAPPPAARRCPPQRKFVLLCDRRLLVFMACVGAVLSGQRRPAAAGRCQCRAARRRLGRIHHLRGLDRAANPGRFLFALGRPARASLWTAPTALGRVRGATGARVAARPRRPGGTAGARPGARRRERRRAWCADAARGRRHHPCRRSLQHGTRDGRRGRSASAPPSATSLAGWVAGQRRAYPPRSWPLRPPALLPLSWSGQ